MSLRKKVVYIYSDIELVFWKFLTPSKDYTGIIFRPKFLKIYPFINILFFPILPFSEKKNSPEKSA